MNLIEESPGAAGVCNGLELEGMPRMQHDGAAALIQILMQVMDAGHQKIALSLEALGAVHDVCDAVTVGWLMAAAQGVDEKIALRVTQ